MNTTNDPWYARTEFWKTLATMVFGIVAAANPKLIPQVQMIGAAVAGIAPIVYTWGRNNVKAVQAGKALEAVAVTVTQGK